MSAIPPRRWRGWGVCCDMAIAAVAVLFVSLLDTRSRNAKLRLIGDYLRSTPDPDRGWEMAALTGDLDIKAIKPALIRALIEDRVDPVLFRMSRDYVGDTAETVALLWPGAIEGDSAELRLSDVNDRLASLSRSDAPAAMAALLDRLDRSEEHTSELQSIMRIPYAVFCLKKKN